MLMMLKDQAFSFSSDVRSPTVVDYVDGCCSGWSR